ncbi:hypothetical protein COW77_01200 [Candidatus Wolfebacteria bacterium CG18_big_fil_WC_8_21_14_2_50_39_7]|uniref:Uncharacterized protein n=1 Tax=Candidatus Wolfebacteria bacterium CG18_big_fil_WC_8_21_14_2_50_39_7 TaxID=1975071 RepID=A0A2H0EEC9_9BACT|nr:hypothetical protein [Candidatus Parcubacteria bacterium]NCP58203.1 hypothetical protein [Candidatus Wolfebacteria bacterium]PIP92209.1 MAG: hypothetical protein COW77_01200 [Candidatus Wolfebacteria bacterium CG18_big_fil_WC_8_21_14_2_50_39_7]
MRKDRNKALNLRLSGKSYNEITKILDVPKSTLSGWFSGLELSEKSRKKILERVRKKSLEGLLKRNKNQTALAIKRKIDIRSRASKEIDSISKKNLFFIGITLYWAEGYKRPIIKNGRELTYHSVSLTNSDPDLIKVYLRFLKEICSVPENKINADIRIFKHQNADNLLKYWEKTTGIKKEKFGKVYYGISKSSLGKRPFNRLQYGTIQIRVNDTKLFHRIMGWINGLKKFGNLKHQ